MMEGDWRDGPTTKKCHRLRINTRKWEKGMEEALPRSLQKEPILPTPWFWTAGLQNCEKSISAVLKHPVCANDSYEEKEVTELHLSLHSAILTETQDHGSMVAEHN